MNGYQGNKRKKYYPSKRKQRSPQQYHRKSNKPAGNMQGFFNGNLVQDMKFGAQGHELSGFVERTVMMRDRHGNVQKMSEKQFFNSGNRIGRIRLNGNESHFD